MHTSIFVFWFSGFGSVAVELSGVHFFVEGI